MHIIAQQMENEMKCLACYFDPCQCKTIEEFLEDNKELMEDLRKQERLEDEENEMKIKDSLFLKVKHAIQEDSSVAAFPTTLENHQGTSEERFKELGLTRDDLKRLERCGLAIRGRLPTSTGHRLRWILIIPEGEYGQTL